jgi:hypothetical protein
MDGAFLVGPGRCAAVPVPVAADGWAGAFSFDADPAFRLSPPIGYSGERRSWDRKGNMRVLVAASLGWKLTHGHVSIHGFG